MTLEKSMEVSVKSPPPLRPPRINFGSVCSGIEAASVAWESLGYSPKWLSEIEPFPSAVLAHHWPQVPNLGDMTKIADQILCGDVEAPDVVVGGTPCQAFSVAGLRGGLKDERGFLTVKFVELANAIDNKRAEQQKPESIIVWENVPGVLSSKDNAFGCFLAGLAGESEPLEATGSKWTNAGYVLGPQRAIAWRILDAQYFGVAQRRRRVFVVASARAGFDPAKVLFEFDGLRRDIAPRRKTQKEAPANAGSCPAISSENNSISDAFRMVAFGEYDNDGTASTMKARDYKDATDLVATTEVPRKYHGSTTEVPRKYPVSTTEATYGIPGNWIGRAPENGGNAVEPMHNISPCLTRTDKHGVVNGMQVRRLTPTECERLQGFPDGHTAIGWKGKPAPDGQRYKALGNSMAVPVMRWIGQRILNNLI